MKKSKEGTYWAHKLALEACEMAIRHELLVINASSEELPEALQEPAKRLAIYQTRQRDEWIAVMRRYGVKLVD